MAVIGQNNSHRSGWQSLVRVVVIGQNGVVCTAHAAMYMVLSVCVCVCVR